MASYSPIQNYGYGLNPFDWSRGNGVAGKVGADMDPFNLFGDNKKPDQNTTGPQPDYPDYQAAGMLPPQFQAQANGPDQDVLGMLHNTALSAPGESPWAQAAKQKQTQDEAQQTSDATARGNTMGAQAMDSAAMRGGLSHGASSMANTQAAASTMDAKQKVANTGMGARNAINMQDAGQNIALAENLPGIQNQANAPGIQANEFNISNDLGQGNAMNAFNLGRYQSQMSAWGASKQADATANSGKK